MLLPLGLLAAHAEGLAPQGYLKGTAGVPVFAEPSPDLGARLQLDLSDKSEHASWRVAADLSADLTGLGDPNEAVDLRAVEVKAALHHPVFDLSLGKQYVFWGSTDWVNPTDVFTPWDYLHMSSELEDYRLAPWAARWTGWRGNGALDVVWVPFPEPDIVVPGPVQLPERTLRNGSFGARATTTVAGFDLAAMAYRGMDKRPDITAVMDTQTMPPTVELQIRHGRVTVVGGDIVRGVGPVLFKGEAAGFLTPDKAGDDPDVRNRDLLAVAGVTYVPTQALNFTVQGTWGRVFDYVPDTSLMVPPQVVDPSPSSVDSFGLVERAAYSWRDLVSLSLVGVQGLEERDSFEMILLTWKARDGLEVLGGAILFSGPEGSRFGGLHEDSQAFVEAKASF